jgi:hypothetical protein
VLAVTNLRDKYSQGLALHTGGTYAVLQ